MFRIPSTFDFSKSPIYYIHGRKMSRESINENFPINASIINKILKTAFFILIASLLINLIIYFVGEDTLSNLLQSNNILVYFISSLIGLIPNCASSVVITEVFLSNLTTIGVALSGLLTGSGIGLLLLFKSNKNINENLTILGIIYIVGVLIGFIVDLII